MNIKNKIILAAILVVAVFGVYGTAKAFTGADSDVIISIQNQIAQILARLNVLEGSVTTSLNTPVLVASLTTPSQNIQATGGAPNATQATYNFSSSAGAATITELKFNVIGSDGSPSQTVTNICVGNVCASPVSDIAYLTGFNLSVPNMGAGLTQTVKVSYSAVGLGGLNSGVTSTIALSYVKYIIAGKVGTITANIAAPTMTLIGGVVNQPTTCTPKWNYSNWSACTNSLQTRTATDINNCGVTINRPVTSQTCNTAAILLKCKTLSADITRFINLNGTVYSSSAKFRKDYDVDKNNRIDSSDVWYVGYYAAISDTARCAAYLEAGLSYDAPSQSVANIDKESQIASIQDAIARLVEQLGLR